MADSHTLQAQVNGWPQPVKLFSPVDRPTLDRLGALTFAPSGGVYVCHHVPTNPEGVDFYRIFREENPGMTAYVGYTVFETDSIPDRWVEPCNDMDEIWVPSRFNVETFSRAGVRRDKLHVIPHGFDPKEYRPDETAPLGIGESKGFNFLSIFEWTFRKGWDVLIRAYLEEFSAKEDVRLIMRAYQGGGVLGAYKKPVLEQLTEYIKDLGYDRGDIPDIEFIDRMIPADLMPGLYKAADAFVLPTRGEGWGIPFTESMLMGVPVIATRWSGHLQFMNEENAYLIDIDGVNPVSREQVIDSPFYGGHKWAEPSVAHTRKLLRRVFERRDEAREKGRAARAHILGHFTTRHAALKIAERVRVLERGRLGRTFHPVSFARDEKSASAEMENPQGTQGKANAIATRASQSGGEKGMRVLFCLGPNFFITPGENRAYVLELKRCLERPGVQVDFTSHPDTALAQYDLVHLFHMDETFAINAAGQKKPYLVTPGHGSSSRPDAESMKAFTFLLDWSHGGDEEALHDALKRLEETPLPDASFGLDFIYSNAEAVLVNSKESWKNIAARFPGAARVEVVHPGFDRMESAAAGPDLFVSEYGVEDFVLCAGPLEPKNNQLMLLYALKDERVPLVFFEGAAMESDYAAACRAFSRRGKTVFTGELSPKMLASAFSAAKVYAEPGWAGQPGAAAMGAAWHGLNLALTPSDTASALFGQSAFYLKPLNPRSVGQAVLDAYEAPQRSGPPEALPETLKNRSFEEHGAEVFRLYQEILGRVQTRSGRAPLERRAAAAKDALLYHDLLGNVSKAIQRMPDEGLRLARDLADLRPNNHVIWYVMGSALLMKGDHWEAESHFRTCIRLKPVSNPQGYLSLALSLLRQDRYGEAVEVLVEALELHPLVPDETRNLLHDYLRRASRGLISDTQELIYQ